jgi:hypothetical protein
MSSIQGVLLDLVKWHHRMLVVALIANLEVANIRQNCQQVL